MATDSTQERLGEASTLVTRQCQEAYDRRMFKGLASVALALLLLVGALSTHPTAQAVATANDGPRFSPAGALQRPADYREWVYLTSGLGMTYGPTQPAAGEPRFFDNVFVNRESYRSFLQTGQWPDKTMFILEIRSAEQRASINNGGQTQGTRILAIEAAVKDVARFREGGWGYFDFGGGDTLKAEVPALPSTERCYACHRDNTAVDNTFVQFYPTLMEVAQRMGTVKPTYDPNHKVGQ